MTAKLRFYFYLPIIFFLTNLAVRLKQYKDNKSNGIRGS